MKEKLGGFTIRQWTYTFVTMTTLDLASFADISHLIASMKAGRKLEDELAILKAFEHAPKKAMRARVHRSSGSSSKRKRAAPAAGHDPADDPADAEPEDLAAGAFAWCLCLFGRSVCVFGGFQQKRSKQHSCTNCQTVFFE
jgi:hypothetical protein